ncbi:MAG: isopeptide-forming domain-containing fimbrial protein [Oscillospiraceae bacterium]|nr:isopeptide-forming domain-containing fimbrial protein [Oscillospiraceae bacterium]
MKKLKKLLSIVLAVAMVMSLAVSVTATTYSITINNDTNGYTYTAYQIFAGTLSDDETTLSNITWGSGVSITDESAFYNALAAVIITNASGDTLYPFTKNNQSGGDALTSAEEVAEMLAKYADDYAEEIANAFADFLVDGSYLGTSTSLQYDSGSYSATGLEAGYYLVYNSSVPSGTGTAYSAYIVQLVDDVQMDPKDSVPTLAKDIDDINDSTETTATTSTTDSADYDIGDDVPFTLTATIGDDDYSKYDTYTLIFHDTLTSGLTIDTTSVKVMVGSAEVNENCYTVGDVSYTYTSVDLSNVTSENYSDYFTRSGTDPNYTYTPAASYDDTGSTTYYKIETSSFTVTISDTTSLKDTSGNDITVTTGTAITVTYTAELNENATYKEQNTAYLEYSNNPNDEDDYGTTTTGLTTVFNYTLTVNKTDPDGTALEGAGFTLYKYNGSDYAKVGDEVTGTDLTSFVWEGLDDGKYKLEKTTTPDGYNTMTPVEFYIVASHTESEITSLKVTSDADGNNEIADWNETESSGTITVSIKNEKGSNLPETGGIGVTIFYVVGGILVLAATGVIVINRKKIKK